MLAFADMTAFSEEIDFKTDSLNYQHDLLRQILA